MQVTAVMKYDGSNWLNWFNTPLNDDYYSGSIAFDNNGIPYDGSYELTKRIKNKIEIIFNSDIKIYIMPESGRIIY